MMHLVHCNDVLKLTSLVLSIKSLKDVILSTQNFLHYIFANKIRPLETYQNKEIVIQFNFKRILISRSLLRTSLIIRYFLSMNSFRIQSEFHYLSTDLD